MRRVAADLCLGEGAAWGSQLIGYQGKVVSGAMDAIARLYFCCHLADLTFPHDVIEYGPHAHLRRRSSHAGREAEQYLTNWPFFTEVHRIRQVC